MDWDAVEDHVEAGVLEKDRDEEEVTAETRLLVNKNADRSFN